MQEKGLRIYFVFVYPNKIQLNQIMSSLSRSFFLGSQQCTDSVTAMYVTKYITLAMAVIIWIFAHLLKTLVKTSHLLTELAQIGGWVTCTQVIVKLDLHSVL